MKRIKNIFPRVKITGSGVDPFHILDKEPIKQVKKTKIITGQFVRKIGSTQPSKSSLIVVALISGIFGGYFIFQSFAATPVSANLWVNLGSTGSCTRSAPAAYSVATSCSSFDAAWDKASVGDIIVVKAGTYPTQKVTGNKTSEIKIIGEDGVVIFGTQECRPEFGAVAVFCAEAANMTLENVTIDSGPTSGIGSCSRIWPEATNVTWRNVKCRGDHVYLYVEAPNFQWLGGELGGDDDGLPRITCNSGGGEPLWLQSGADGAIIDGIKFPKRLIQSSPTPSQGACGADGLPHLETIRFEDADNVTIKNSFFAPGSDAGSGHIFSSQDVDNLTLINNYWGPVNGTYWIQATNGGNSNWTMLYNTFTQGSSMASSGQTWVGNLGYYQGCSGTHIKNMWSGTGSCGTDTFVGSTSLGVGSDGRLATTSPAINAAETDTASDYCTGTLVSSIDFEGTTRPQGLACDAGADEYGAGSTTPPPPPPPPPPSDTTAPVVSLTAPANGAIASGTVTLSATASDNVGVTMVDFLVDGTKVDSDLTSPYSVSWNSSSVSNGSHSITAIAYDAASNNTTSAPVSISTNNIAPAPSSGSVAAYNFEEGSGTTASDASGNNNVLTMPSTAWTTAGKNGKAANFNGTASSFAQKADNNTLDIGANGTIETWFKPAALGIWHGLIAKGNANDPNAHNYSLEIDSNNKANCSIGNGSASTTITGTTSLVAGTFYHLACVWDGTNLKLFIDGVQNVSVAQGITPAGNTSNLYVGQYGGNVDQANGVVDDVRIYSKALSASEISGDMNTAVNAGPADSQAPTAPTTLTATATAYNKVDLAWSGATDNVGVTNYLVYSYLSSANPNTAAVIANLGNVSSYTDSTVAPNTGYSYYVISKDAAGNLSPASATKTASTPQAPPDSTPPTAPVASLVSSSTTQINISWTASSDPDSGIKGYEVWRDGTKISGSNLLTGLSFGEQGTFVAGQTYNYVVKAINNSSSTITAQTTRDSNTLAVTISSQTGTLRYVSPTGNDANACTQAAPCRTISRAYALAVPGDTVELAAGTTYGSGTIAFRSGMTGAPVTVRPANGATVSFTDLDVDAGNIIIKGPNFNIRSMNLGNSGTASTRRVDITLDNLNVDAQDTLNTDAIWIGNTTNLTIKNSKVGNTMAGTGSSDTAKSVMTCAGNSTCHNINMTFENNLFYDADTPSGSLAHLECIWVGGVQGFTLRNNTFRDCTYYNVFVTVVLVNNQPQPKDHIFENNLFGQTLNTSGGDANYSIDVHGDVQPNNFEFKYNTFEGPLATANGGGAIQSGGWKIIGNIMAGGVWLAYNQSQGCRSGIVFEYNVMPTACGSNTTVASSADIRSGWVAPKPSYGGADDFHLLSTSPAVNKGRPADAGTLDYDGVTRANPPDAGAYEFISSTPPPPPPPTDTTPTAQITKPTANAVISGNNYSTTTNATDDKGISKVEFYLDNVLKLAQNETAGSLPLSKTYSYNFDTNQFTNNTTHSFSVKVYDGVNTTPTTASVNFTANNPDTTKPNAPTGLTGTVTSPTSVDLTWNIATDVNPGTGAPVSGVTGYNILRNNTVIGTRSASSCSSTCSYTDPTNNSTGNLAPTADTSYSYVVQAVDGATNVSANSTPAPVKTPLAQDSTSPTTPSNVTASAVSTSQINLAWTASTDPTVSGQTTAGLAGYNIYRGTSANNISTTPVNTNLVTTTSFGDTGLTASTTYYYQIEAQDGAGNKSPKSTTVNATTQSVTPPPPVDTTPPDTTITANPTNPSTATSASFSFSSNESGSTFACKLDTAAFASCSSPKPYSSLTVGSHTFQVQATDLAGNTDPTPASYTWTITAPADTTPPTVSVGQPVGSTQTNATGTCDTATTRTCSGFVNFTATAYDPPSTTNGTDIGSVQFKLDGANVGNPMTTSPYLLTIDTKTLANASYNVTATAVDIAGNSTTSALRTFTVDNPDNTNPNPPTSLCGITTQPTNTSQSKVELTWPAATDKPDQQGPNGSGIKSYLVQRNGITIATVPVATTKTCNGQTYAYSYTDNNVPVDSHTYTVRAVDNANLTSTTASPPYNTQIFAVVNPTDTTAPTAPASLVAQAVSYKQINLAWGASNDPGSPSSGVKEYRIFRDNKQVATLPASSCNNGLCTWGESNLRPKTTYTYQVQAVDNASNVSPMSNSATATTLQSKKSDLNGDGTVNIFDLSILAANWGSTNATPEQGDFNGDGKVDIFDLAILASEWGS